jgi:hypothetical protein
VAYIVWGIIFSHAGAIKQEPHGLYVLALALAERSHEFVKLGGLLNLKENLVVAISDLDAEVLGTLGSFLSGAVARLLLVRHCASGCGAIEDDSSKTLVKRI